MTDAQAISGVPRADPIKIVPGQIWRARPSQLLRGRILITLSPVDYGNYWASIVMSRFDDASGYMPPEIAQILSETILGAEFVGMLEP